MESDWQEVQRICLPPTEDDQFGPIANIGTISFDTHEELLWVGTIHGHVTSYYWPVERQLQKYTALPAHGHDEGSVQQFLFNDRGVLSVAANSVHFMIRRALTLWHLADIDMTHLACMSFLGKDSSQILVAGCQKFMFKIDVQQGSIIERLPATSEYIMLKNARLYICAATSTGSIDFLHPQSLDVVKTWNAHSSKISSIDAGHDYLVTCGWSTRPYGNPSLDTIAKVYDLKRLEQLAPISFPAGAAFVQVHPKLATTSVVASQNGQVHIADIANTDQARVVHMSLSSFMTVMVMSASGNVWAIVDQDNAIQLWASHPKLNFCDTPRPTEFADAVAPVPHMTVDSDLPFGTIGMPFYHEKLASNWGFDRISEVLKPPLAIDPDVLKQLQPDPNGIGRAQWVRNPRKTLRNPVDLLGSRETNGSSPAMPRPTGQRNSHDERRIHAATNSFAHIAVSSKPESVPQLYQYVPITYPDWSKLPFNFESYNGTVYSGLENDFTNCYLNSFLQILRFTTIIRNLSLHHVAGSCLSDGCLLCEMGFLFDMLEKAAGVVCRATNLVKTFSSRPEAVKLSILEEQSLRNTLEARLSAANRFILQQICADFRNASPYDSALDKAFVTNGLQGFKCLNCGYETYRPESSHVTTLMYPDLGHVGRHRNHTPRFTEALNLGFQGELRCRGWCLGCKRYASMDSQRTITDLSDVLVVNAGLDKSPKSRQAWATPGWLPQEIGITIEAGNITCNEGKQLQPFRNYRNTVVYELVGVVAEIAGVEPQKPHLVSLVDVALSNPKSQAKSQWHLFNDFLVAPIDQHEALNFSPPWKSPVMLTYQVKHARNTIDYSWKESLDINPLYYNGSMNQIGHPSSLKPNEPMPAGTLVAIDAEFVVLQKAEYSIPFDWVPNEQLKGLKTILPDRHALGRVSVLRGSGPEEGEPFIDDYVIVNEEIVDYLTRYSGIEEGDLDPRTSKHAPMHLKVAYKKLWLLLNLGCIFIGHGLNNDFRSINIHVPDAQFIDTSKLYQKGEYTLKLSVIASVVLKEEIQTGNHDSVEDARAALNLYRKYQEFVARGVLEQKVDECYAENARLQAWGKKKGKREAGGGSADLGGVSGRMTPEVGIRGVGSGPGTPVGRGKGREEGYFESPLRA